MTRAVMVFGLVATVAGCGAEPRGGGDRAERRVRTVSVRTADSPIEQASHARGREDRRSRQDRQDQQAREREPAAPRAAIKEADAIGALTSDEPCATRLHALAGTMLFYYAMHRRLPARLDELRTLADIDQDLQFACPTSGQPYVYVPAGLRYRDKLERLVLYDAEPSHGGQRWGIVAAPARGERPAATWAVRLPEDVFREYAPETPADAPVPPTPGR